jgi:N-acyl-D-amino-acid deacylase
MTADPRRMLRTALALTGALVLVPGCSKSAPYDVVIRGGTVYDGTGAPGVLADVAIKADTIAAVGTIPPGSGAAELDATNLAVAPGFINMLSWANVSLLHDGRSQGGIRQGVTLEVMGEGSSMGPLTDSMRAEMIAREGDIKYDVPWTTLGEYLEHLERHGISTNVASFIGAGTVRIHEVGYANRPATPAELARMQDLVRQAMREGALGVGSSLIYAPDNYASTDELIALARAAGEDGGMYISHMRDEGTHVLDAVDELLRIASAAGVRAEIYHLKASGRANWPKLDSVIAKVDSARQAGLVITADIYTYPASSTGLDATMPTWVQEGGHAAWVQRLKDPAIRARLAREMRGGAGGYDNSFANAGGPDGILLVSFRQDSLRYLIGKTLGNVARMRGTPPEETAMDLVVQDDSRVGCVFFTMSEENVRKKIALPWVSFGSDAGSYATEGVFLKTGTHPRAYGNVARLLGKYVREEHVIPLEEAIRKLTSLPATNLRLDRRGQLAPGYFADVVVFDPATIIDHATFEKPHQYSTGVRDVFVNGVEVLRDGVHTGATPGRFVRGPGSRGAHEPSQ